jgi:hypothetical protein
MKFFKCYINTNNTFHYEIPEIPRLKIFTNMTIFPPNE